MFARRVVPALPFLLLAIEGSVAAIGNVRLERILLVGALVGACLPWRVFTDEGAQRVRGIANEPAFYPHSVVELRRAQGAVVGRALAGTDARVMIEGGMLMFAYYSDLPYVVEMTGLTQYSLARLPIEKRGRVGHEKAPTPQWMDDNDIQLVVLNDLPPFDTNAPLSFDEVYVDDIAKLSIWVYVESVMSKLDGRPGVRFVPIERTLDDAAALMLQGSYEQARFILAKMSHFYLDRAGPGANVARERMRQIVYRKRAEQERAPE